MKKITLLLSALMMTGAAFAHDGKGSCCKSKKENGNKEAHAKKEKDCKEKSCCQKKGAETAKK